MIASQRVNARLRTRSLPTHNTAQIRVTAPPPVATWEGLSAVGGSRDLARRGSFFKRGGLAPRGPAACGGVYLSGIVPTQARHQAA